ncbi:MAG: hypothetical protein ACRENA_15700 [Vulcanimicrobiaceae bacterium]
MREMTYDVTFVDTLWKALKAWAKEQAAGNVLPTIEECAAEVRRIAGEIIGPHGSLRADAITFFAAETNEMVVKLAAASPTCDSGT